MAKSDADKAREVVGKVAEYLSLAEHYLAQVFEHANTFVEGVYAHIPEGDESGGSDEVGTDEPSPQDMYEYIYSRADEDFKPAIKNSKEFLLDRLDLLTDMYNSQLAFDKLRNKQG